MLPPFSNKQNSGSWLKKRNFTCSLGFFFHFHVATKGLLFARGGTEQGAFPEYHGLSWLLPI